MRLPRGATWIERRLPLMPIILALMLLQTALLAADPLSRVIDADTLSRLRAGGALSSSVPADGTLRLLPKLGRAEAVPVHPTVGVELLSLLAGGSQPLDTPEGMLRLYNALHAVSTLEGVTYYSVTRGSMQVLFSRSFAVSSPRGNVRIPDPVFDALPSADVMYTFQEDQSFGRNTYQETFASSSDHLSVRIENLTSINLLFVPIIRPHDLVSYVALVPAGSELAFYGLAWLNTSFPIGDRHSREESLLNRLKALERWLAARIGASL